MIGINNVNPRRDFVSARYGQFAPSANKSSGVVRSSKKSSNFRRSNSNYRHESSSNNDFMSKLKDSTSSGNVYIPSNDAESIDINNYVENLLM